MDMSPFFFSPMKAMQRIATSVLHHNNGFINHVFCRNWAVRNPAGTRLDSSSLVNKQVEEEEGSGTECVLDVPVRGLQGQSFQHWLAQLVYLPG